MTKRERDPSLSRVRVGGVPCPRCETGRGRDDGAAWKCDKCGERWPKTEHGERGDP